MIHITRQDSSSNISISSIDSSDNILNNVSCGSFSLESEMFQIIESKVADASFVLRLGLSKREIYVIQLLMAKQCGLFGDIGKQIATILEDGKIDPTDIPNLILFIKDLIHFPISNLNIKVKDLIDFIENILLILLQSGIIKTNDTKLYESLLKSSVTLLESSIDLNETVKTTCKCSLWKWF